MTTLHSYINFGGNCAEAMRFYEEVLHGKLDLMTVGSSPMAAQMPPGSDDRILHASLSFDGGRLLASDTMPGMPYEGIKGAWLTLGYTTLDAARPVFDALAAGGTVTMPMEKTFWADGFGMLIDRFGVSWMFNVGPEGT